jgi:hypothetical protein
MVKVGHFHRMANKFIKKRENGMGNPGYELCYHPYKSF